MNSENKYVIECQSYVQAAQHAASMDLSIHNWTWLPSQRYVNHKKVTVYVNAMYLDPSISGGIKYDPFTE